MKAINALVQKLKPELLGRPLMEYRPADFSDREAVEKFFEIIREYEEKAVNLSDDMFPMDYHYYMIKQNGTGTKNVVNVEVDFSNEFIGVDYVCSDKKKRKIMDKIMRDIYFYYGVTADDIKNNSERLQRLLEVLAAG